MMFGTHIFIPQVNSVAELNDSMPLSNTAHVPHVCPFPLGIFYATVERSLS
jgi:hypothetical protein